MKARLMQLGRICSHPSDEYNEMKHAHDWPVFSACIVLAVWFLSAVLEGFVTDFKFNHNNLNELNILYMLAATVGLYLVFCVINWALTTLLDGEGALVEIFVSCALALAPYVASKLLAVAVSGVLTQDEGMFITIIEGAGLVWTAYIFISAQRTIHDYTFGKTLVCLLFTAAGILFVLFLLVLFFGLVQQFVLFFRTIWVEISLRR